jgi:glutamate synthase domain-containing protein 2
VRGEFFINIFAMDREELPLNLAQREWLKHAVCKTRGNVAFGLSQNLNVLKIRIFNASFLLLFNQFAYNDPKAIGEGAREPYKAKSIFNLSGMSYGVLPKLKIDLVGVLMRNGRGLKNRISIVVSGKLVNPCEVAWALSAGAGFITSARGFLFFLGCIQALKCKKHLPYQNYDPRFQMGLVPDEKWEKVAVHVICIVKEVEVIAHLVGVSEFRKVRRDHVRIVQTDTTISTLHAS